MTKSPPELDFNSSETVSHEQALVGLLEQGDDCFLFCRGQLLGTYEHRDLYARNILLVQLFLCQNINPKILSSVFHLSVPYISTLVGEYRRLGSEGLRNNTAKKALNSQKIKGKVADYLIDLLAKEERPTYQEAACLVKKRFRKTISASRIGNGWREDKKMQSDHRHMVQQSLKGEDYSLPEVVSKGREEQDAAHVDDEDAVEFEGVREQGVHEVEEESDRSPWQYNVVAGSFLLYGMLNKGQFLRPFIDGIQGALYQGKKSVERVILTLFFMHGLRLKSIEQTKHLSEEHFSPLVLGAFYRQQRLRYAIDDIVRHKHFDRTLSAHFQNLSQQTDRSDEIYYTDGHFSCYYGKYAVPKGYDSRRQQPSRGRKTIYLHNSLGHNVLSFESPTNTTLSVDIETLIEKMSGAFGEVKGKTLFFDRGGFSAKCFKEIKRNEMYFTPYLKHRKKGPEVDLDLFEEHEIELAGETIKDRLFEKAQETKVYGKLRTILFIGKQGKQIPVISTNLTLSAAEIVARLQKRWVEENGFKYRGEHYNIDLLTPYKVEQAPDKIMIRADPKRKEMNGEISVKEQELKKLKEDYATRFQAVEAKKTVTIEDFEKQEGALLFAIKNVEMELGLLALEKDDIPTKVVSNLKDECVMTQQKRRLFINLIKAMNYNCEKALQDLFSQYHPKKDETLSLIRHVLKTPGWIRLGRNLVEVKLERLDSKTAAMSLDRVLEALSKKDYFKLPDGRELAIVQAL